MYINGSWRRVLVGSLRLGGVLLADLGEGAEQGGAGFVVGKFATAEDEQVVDVEEVIEGVDLHTGA